MSSEAQHLARLRRVAARGAAGLGVERKTRAALVLAVGELCANSIEHAYEAGAASPFTCRSRVSRTGSCSRWEDFGRARGREGYVEPGSLDALPDHGLGIHLRTASPIRLPSTWYAGSAGPAGPSSGSAVPADRSIVDGGGGAPARSGEAMDIEVTRSAAITVIVPRAIWTWRPRIR